MRRFFSSPPKIYSKNIISFFVPNKNNADALKAINDMSNSDISILNLLKINCILKEDIGFTNILPLFKTYALNFSTIQNLNRIYEAIDLYEIPTMLLIMMFKDNVIAHTVEDINIELNNYIEKLNDQEFIDRLVNYGFIELKKKF